MDISYLLLLQQFREGTGGIFNGFFQFLTDLGWSVLPFLIVAMVYWCMDKKIGEYMLINSAASSWLNSLFKLTACIYRPWIRSDALKPLVQACVIDKAPRRNERPSDHTPVVVTLGV